VRFGARTVEINRKAKPLNTTFSSDRWRCDKGIAS
jgi:hypothetical protein